MTLKLPGQYESRIGPYKVTVLQIPFYVQVSLMQYSEMKSLNKKKVKFLDNWFLLFQLTKRDFNQKYIESYLGLAWAVLEPLATTIILSVIFSFGYSKGINQDVPFFVFMFTGMVAFNFFSMATNEGTSVIRDYSFLIKKINFKLSILPIMKNLTCGIFHLIMMVILIFVLLFNGFYPSIYWLQFVYYFFAMNLLALGISWMASAVSVFIPDIKHLVSISLKFLFYLSPIFWSIGNVPEKWRYVLKLNPMHYIINGYRDSFIYNKPFWIYPTETITFWLITLSFLFLGTKTFKKLRPSFADVI